MENSHLNICLNSIISNGSVSDQDVLNLRRDFYSDDVISLEEANKLFKINDSCAKQTLTWVDFYLEAITLFIVDQVEPKGYISDENAHWLIESIAADGKINSATELELLILIIEKASFSPPHLAEFTLLQVKEAVLNGSGLTRRNLKLTPGVIGEAEIQLISRILYAISGDGGAGISRTEAEILFDLNDQTLEAENDPKWSNLFVNAIANHLMLQAGYQHLSKKEAIRLDEWLNDTSIDLERFGRQMVSGAKQNITNLFKKSVAEKQVTDLIRGEHEELTKGESLWLIERIKRDHHITENETKLIAFIKENASILHPSFETLSE